MNELLTDKNFLLYAAKHYHNVHCTSVEEFLEDLKRIKYIKKLLTRYIETGELKERLILNHIIILNNVLSSEALSRILYLKLESYMKYLKPFLILLNIYNEKMYNIKKEGIIDLTNIPMDQKIIERLRAI